MKCPICSSTELSMTAREGIEIDYCPACRGLLDRGELDQIIRRASQATLQEAGRICGQRVAETITTTTSTIDI